MKRVLALVLTMTMLVSVLSFGSIMNVGASQYSINGDVNTDGEINLKDVLALRKYLAGIIFDIDEDASDCNQDGAIDMKDVLLLRKSIAGIDTLPSITPIVVPTQSPVTGKVSKYGISIDNPTINFMDGTGYTLGVWWWTKVDDTKRDIYMDFLKANQVTEIYYECYTDLYGSSTQHEKLHAFVQKAMSMGMRVAAMFDDRSDALKDYDGSSEANDPKNDTFKKVVNGYLTYKSEYPSDDLYAIHCDIEPKTKDELTKYVNIFLGQKVAAARQKGIKVELDLSCGFDTTKFGGDSFTYGGIDGIYNIIANNCDTMCLMSYRDTYEEVYQLAYNSLIAGSAYGTKVVMGLEFGNSGEVDKVDFYKESKYYAYNVMCQVIEQLAKPKVKSKVKCEVGFAIHSMPSFYGLANNCERDSEFPTV